MAVTRKETSAESGDWSVYLIRTSDGSYYAGITTDVARRWREHCSGTKKAAKFFRIRKPERLAYVEGGHTRSSAARRESRIKRLTHAEKRRLSNLAVTR